MNPLQDLLTESDSRLAAQCVRFATNQLSLPAGLWICVGSRAIGSAGPESDIDLLFFSRHLQKFLRLDALEQGVRVSVCAAPIQNLLDDAYEGKYGGYFAAKMLNPWLPVKESDVRVRTHVQSAPYLYFYPFIKFAAQKYNLTLTSESMTALAFIILINIIPDYDAYFMKLYASQDFPIIWESLVQQFELSSTATEQKLRTAKHPTVIHTSGDLYLERAARAANHWSFGTHTHNGRPDFYDHYRSMTGNKLATLGGRGGEIYDRMTVFLLRKSGLPQLFL